MAEVVCILKCSAMGVGLSSLSFFLHSLWQDSFSLFSYNLVILLSPPLPSSSPPPPPQFSFLSYLKLLICQNGKKIVLMYHPKSMQIGNRSYFIRYDSSWRFKVSFLLWACGREVVWSCGPMGLWPGRSPKKLIKVAARKKWWSRGSCPLQVDGSLCNSWLTRIDSLYIIPHLQSFVFLYFSRKSWSNTYSQVLIFSFFIFNFSVSLMLCVFFYFLFWFFFCFDFLLFPSNSFLPAP